MHVGQRQFTTLMLASISIAGCTSWGIAFAGSIRHDRCVAEYKKLGTEDAFRCVGEVRLQRKPGPAAAVLIAPKWAVTAAHVATKLSPESDRIVFGDQEFCIARRVLHPEFDAAPPDPDTRLALQAAGTDIALLQLDRAAEHVRPALRYQWNREIGSEMTMIGYGIVGDGLRGIQRPPRQERLGGRNMIDKAGGRLGALAVSDHVLLCDFDHPDDPEMNRFGSACPLPLEICPTPGDSGGGWFIEDEGGWKLVGICFGWFSPTGHPKDGTPARYGHIEGGVRVSTANEWIDSVIGR